MAKPLTKKGNSRHEGSLVYQVVQLLNDLTAFGFSRHTAKQRARDAGLGKPVGIHGRKTLIKYTGRSIHFVKWCRREYGLRSLEAITQPMVDGYFASIAHGSAWTWDTQIAALNKLRVAMELQGQHWRVALPPGRPRKLAMRRHQESYSAEEIRRLLIALRPPYRLMAQLQWELGIRWVSVERLRVRDIGPRLHVSGKGGKEQWLPITRVTRNVLFRWTRDLPTQAKVFDRTYGAYRAALVRACAIAALPYGGSHALRRSFARRRLGELMRQGLTEREARRIIAKEMGHGDNRGRITLAYHASVEADIDHCADGGMTTGPLTGAHCGFPKR